MAQKMRTSVPNGGRYRVALLVPGLFVLAAPPAGAVTISANFITRGTFLSGTNYATAVTAAPKSALRLGWR